MAVVPSGVYFCGGKGFLWLTVIMAALSGLSLWGVWLVALSILPLTTPQLGGPGQIYQPYLDMVV